MTDRPIIFAASMIHAILDGRKTQTRRIIKPQPSCAEDMIRKMSPWAIGDRLWVRERITSRPMANFLTGEPIKTIVAAYAADNEDVVESAGFNVSPWWNHDGDLAPIHMPRWASRLTLEVTGVKVERLQEISEEDAIAEGIELWHQSAILESERKTDEWCRYSAKIAKQRDQQRPRAATNLGAFAMLWNSIHGPGAWEANPWVNAVSFKIKGNVTK
jgi:hypothetical protein